MGSAPENWAVGWLCEAAAYTPAMSYQHELHTRSPVAHHGSFGWGRKIILRTAYLHLADEEAADQRCGHPDLPAQLP